MKAFNKTAVAVAVCAVTVGVLGVGSAAIAAPKYKAPAPAPTATSAPAVAPVAPSVFAVDQWAVDAANTNNQMGSTIWDLAVKGGQVYAGYGDYNANVGPVAVGSYDLTSAAATQRYILNGEEAAAIRSFDGNLYVPDIDPKLDWTAPVGFATDAPGTWSYVAANDGSGMEHVYDVAKVGQNIFVAGSMVNPDKAKYGAYAELAVIKASHDGGKTWAIERTRASSDMNNGNDRYYWLGVAGGKVYAQAALHAQAAPLEVWANGAWSTATAEQIPMYLPKTVTLGNRVLFPMSGKVGSLDATAKGKAAATVTQSTGATAPQGSWVNMDDLYSDGTTAYAIGRIFNMTTKTSTYSTVWKSTDGVTWTKVADVAVPFTQRFTSSSGVMKAIPDYLSSVAVSGGQIILGGSNGTLYTTPLK